MTKAQLLKLLEPFSDTAELRVLVKNRESAECLVAVAHNNICVYVVGEGYHADKDSLFGAAQPFHNPTVLKSGLAAIGWIPLTRPEVP